MSRRIRMKVLIDSLSSSTGWSIDAPSTIEEIGFKEYVAGLNSQSLLITYDSTDSVRVATKTLPAPVDVTNYKSLIFSIWSQTKGTNHEYIKPSDFVYKITLDGVNEFLVPIYNTFSDIVIGIEDINTISEITITPLHADTDSIAISEMVAEKEELPFDILFAVKEHIEYYSNIEHGDGMLIGQITGSIGDTSISLTDPPYLSRYGVIKISDGNNSEIHQIDDNDSLIYQFNKNYSGGALLNNYAGANVYLMYPVYINPGQYEISLPGFAVWGIDGTPILRGGKLDIQRDTFTTVGSKERIEGQLYQYDILIDCEARQQRLIDILGRVVRRFIAKESLWINGRRHDVSFTGKPEEIRPAQGIDYLPKIQYSLTVEVKENINDRSAVPLTSSITVESNIQGG
jgi:hypothetical protein